MGTVVPTASVDVATPACRPSLHTSEAAAPNTWRGLEMEIEREVLKRCMVLWVK
jgi:hypothetical protein